jgi:hypothetical protein
MAQRFRNTIGTTNIFGIFIRESEGKSSRGEPGGKAVVDDE